MKGINTILFKVSLFTSPLIGLFSILPIWFFVDSLPEDGQFVFQFTTNELVPRFLMIIIYVWVVWFINIWLFHFFNKTEKNRRKEMEIWRYLLSYVIVFSIIFIITKYRIASNPNIDRGLFQYYPIVGSLVNNTLILLLMNVIIQQRERAILQLQKAELEINQLLMQQEQLKQQIHPHFLFNALTTLQVLIKNNVDKALQYSQELANYLRQSIDFSRHNLIPLDDDLTFCINYIKLQQIRFADEITYFIDIPEPIRNQYQVPVHTLQVLAENAIKHNSFSLARPLNVTFQYEEGYLKITNNIFPKFNKESTPGTGLENLAKRFKQYTSVLPEIDENEKEFSVKIKLLDK